MIHERMAPHRYDARPNSIYDIQGKAFRDGLAKFEIALGYTAHAIDAA
jgi:hypothetical protein